MAADCTGECVWGRERRGRTVARAHELVGGLVPGNDATQVSADSVDAKVLHLALVGDDEVGGIALEALDELAVAGVGLDPLSDDDIVAKGILSQEAAAVAAGLGGGEVGDEDGGEDEDGASDLREKATSAMRVCERANSPSSCLPSGGGRKHVICGQTEKDGQSRHMAGFQAQHVAACQALQAWV